jgi:hypothetical protein
LYWRAQVWYTNVGNRPYRVVCQGATNPNRYKEHIRRGGEYLGDVAAETTFCTRRGEGWSKVIQPGRTLKSWALFHNVPWRGDKVSIEWLFNTPHRTAFVNPWGRHLH